MFYPQAPIPSPSTTSELDAVIRELGEKMVWAQNVGDPAGARIYLDRMTAVIKSRTPEHQAAIEAEIERRIDELTFGGRWTEEVLSRAAAHFDVPAAAVRRRTGSMRRLRWLCSLVYWTLRHRSLSRGRWVADYERG